MQDIPIIFGFLWIFGVQINGELLFLASATLLTLLACSEKLGKEVGRKEDKLDNVWYTGLPETERASVSSSSEIISYVRAMVV